MYFLFIIKRQKSEGVNGIKTKILNWKLLEENSNANMNIKLKNILRAFNTII